MLDDITMLTKQNIKNIIFVIISYCFIYSVLQFLYFRQKRVFNKNEFLFIIEFLSIIEFLPIIYFVYFRDNLVLRFFY